MVLIGKYELYDLIQSRLAVVLDAGGLRPSYSLVVTEPGSTDQDVSSVTKQSLVVEPVKNFICNVQAILQELEFSNRPA